MPDLDHVAEQVRADMNRAHWAAASDIRTVADRRGRRGQLAIAAAVVFAVGGTAWLTNGARPSPQPAANRPPSPSVEASPSANTSGTSTSNPSSDPTHIGTAIPAHALLASTDVQPKFTGLGAPFEQPYSPNPFSGCGPDGMPGEHVPVAVLGSGLTGGSSTGLTGGESVMKFRAGDAHRTLTAINQLTTGACAGQFHVLRHDLGGDESILVTSGDPPTVGAQAAHGMALYYAVVRAGDTLVWVTLVDEDHRAGQADLVGILAQRATERACATLTC